MSPSNSPSPDNQPGRPEQAIFEFLLSSMHPPIVSIEGFSPPEVAQCLYGNLLCDYGGVPLNQEGLNAAVEKYSKIINGVLMRIKEASESDVHVKIAGGFVTSSYVTGLVLHLTEDSSGEYLAISGPPGKPGVTKTPLFAGLLLTFEDGPESDLVSVRGSPLLDPRFFEAAFNKLTSPDGSSSFLVEHIERSFDGIEMASVIPGESEIVSNFYLAQSRQGLQRLLHMPYDELTGELYKPSLAPQGDEIDPLVMTSEAPAVSPSDSLVDFFRTNELEKGFEEIDLSEEVALAQSLEKLLTEKIIETLGKGAIPEGCSVRIESLFKDGRTESSPGTRVHSYNALVGVCDDNLNFHLPGDPSVVSPTFAGHIFGVKTLETWSPTQEALVGHLRALQWWAPIPEGFIGLFDSNKSEETTGYRGSLIPSQMMERGVKAIASQDEGGCFTHSVLSRAEACMKERGFLNGDEMLEAESVNVFARGTAEDARAFVVLEHRLGLQVMAVDMSPVYSFFDFKAGVSEVAFFPPSS